MFRLFTGLFVTALIAFSVNAQTSLLPIAKLEAAAQQRVNATARLPLGNAATLGSIETFDAGRVPNYLRGLAQIPNAPQTFAQLFKTYITGGTLAPELKAALGLRIAQVNQSPYVAAHMLRLLRASERGAQVAECLKGEKLSELTPAEQLAVRYAELLTRDVHGVTDAEFAKARGQFNDAQMVELTMVVCFFNYFTRYAEALNLPVEAWALDAQVKPALPAKPKNRLTEARIALVSDEEMAAVVAAANAAKESAAAANSLGVGIANSQRAMLLVPDLQAAWRNYGAAVRANSKLGRELQLHVSFAVSAANGCRYCTLHQVLGLRRLAVDPAKLVAMQKDDTQLSTRERAAVVFARKLTRGPGSMTDADVAALRVEFQDYGALEIVLQTGAFSFMNRFTDNLRLPSEDEAIRVYQEVYGVKH
ncbi:MAG: carboxymuconolactone decarboxylase family protein [Acidobacteria bacterium]|nr:carboxymuconolactone decarboxylase family protein [Acidobacteriota bacterium]MBI3425504.1 carboxymuconolactone decarboxylase family protein [Acidobacteriota bacterium]